MERQERLVIRLFSALSFLSLLSCSSAPSDHVIIPGIYREISDTLFSTHQDTLLYNAVKFSGVGFQLSSKHDTVMREEYFDGLRNGSRKMWYDNSQLAEYRLYRHGKKVGTHRGWWPGGKQKFEFGIVNDLYEGEFREWNDLGLLIKHFHYVNGHESGAQMLWYDDGKIRANYVIKDGRRYGLLGTKNCKNISDSVFAK